MKNTAYIVISCLSALVLASCVKDDLYNTPHPDKGALVVTADFSERTEGNAIPDTYVFSVDGKTCDANSAEPFYYPELLPAGVHKLVAYNEPTGMSFTDNVVSVDVLQDGTIEPLPQYLYSYSGSVEAVVDDAVRVTMPMGSVPGICISGSILQRAMLPGWLLSMALFQGRRALST